MRGVLSSFKLINSFLTVLTHVILTRRAHFEVYKVEAPLHFKFHLLQLVSQFILQPFLLADFIPQLFVPFTAILRHFGFLEDLLFGHLRDFGGKFHYLAVNFGVIPFFGNSGSNGAVEFALLGLSS